MIQSPTWYKPGPVVSTSMKVDGWKHTAADRALGGRPVLVFNPENLGKIASTFGWDPLTGCTDPAVAEARPAAPPRPVGARSRLGGGRLGGRSLIAARVKVLRRHLLAATLDGPSVAEVTGWLGAARHGRTQVLRLRGTVHPGRAPARWVAALRRRPGVRPAARVTVGQLVPGSPRRGGPRRSPRRGVCGDAS